MPDLTKVSGVVEDTIEAIDEVAWDDVALITGQTKPAVIATRWMGGGRLGYIFTTTASNGLNGWGDGSGLDGAGSRGGYIVDVGNGAVNSVAYGRSGADPVSDPPRWIFGLDLKTGTKGGICYINSGSGIDGAGRPYYATASNWTSASVPDMADGIQGRQGVAYGNDIWMGAGKELNVSGDYQSFYRSTDYGVNWIRLAESNDENDEAMAVCYKGTGNIWMAAHGKSIWKSTDNGANWSRIFEPDTAIWNCIAYDGATRWMIAGGGGDAWYSDNDGTDWVDQSSRMGTSKNIFGLVYMGGAVNRWIVVGQDGTGKSQTNLAIDEDEDNWDTITALDSTTMNAIATDHTTAIAVGQSGRIWASTNGTSWDLGAADRNDNIGTEALNCIACDIIGAGLYK